MLWFLIVLVGITIIFNRLSLKYSLRGVSYKRELSKNVVEIGEIFEIITTTENIKPLPVPFLKIIEKLPKALYYSGVSNYKITEDYFQFISTFFIMPYQRVKRVYPVYSEERGYFTFRQVELEIGDFIGIRDTAETINYLQELVVLPNILDLDENLIPYGNYYGDISVKRWIIDDPFMYVGIREYTGNEPEKHIHWPSSLKYGNLMVKNFDFTTDNSVDIILNIECTKPFWAGINKDEIEACISLCRGVVEELEYSKIPYSFVNNSYGGYRGEEIRFNNYDDILIALGKIAYGMAIQFEKLMEDIIRKGKSFTTIVIITPRVFDSYIEYLDKLRQNNNKLILISLDDKGLDKLDSSIIKYVRRIL